MKTWTRLCQANVDHYNNHTGSHNAITVVGFVAAVVVINVGARKMAEKDLQTRMQTGRYAR